MHCFGKILAGILFKKLRSLLQKMPKDVKNKLDLQNVNQRPLLDLLYLKVI